MKKNLVLLGMMAVGKSTIGKIVAKQLNLEFIDIDHNIESRNAMKIREIFEKKGEKFFREEEEKETLTALKKNSCVIALGGGAFINDKIRENILKSATSVWLDANIKTLAKRVERNEKRPLLKKNNNFKMIKKIYYERKKIYKLANFKIKCDKMNKMILSKKIILMYEQK